MVTQMYARVTTLETTEQQHEEGVRTVVEQYVPWIREAGGFRGILGLFDAGEGRSIVVTFWDDEGSRDASAAAADRLSALSADVSGARREDMRNYVVDYFELDRESLLQARDTESR
jgi:heme-degrading monooxygenase HmoA